MLGDFTSLDQAVALTAARSPDKCFVLDASRPGAETSHSYRQANELIDSLAGQLSALPRQAVGVLLSTRYECLCLIYAVIRSGRDVVLLDPEWGLAAKNAVIREMGLRHLLSAEPCVDDLSELCVPLDFDRPADGFAADEALSARSRVVVFTSGTTSKPKGIELSQAAMLYAYRLGGQCLGLGPHTRSGCFYRVSGLGILGIHFLFPILHGGSTVILPQFAYFDVAAFWQLVKQWQVNFLYIVPPIANYIVKEGQALEQPFGADQLLCVAGSARLDAEIQRRFQQAFAPLANIYGLSECGFAFLFGHFDGRRYTHSVGPAVGLQLKLTGEDGLPVTEPMRQGRLHVKTASLFEGYVNNPGLTAAVVSDGWLDTRDLAYFDADGCCYIVGRCDGTINKGGNLFHLVECDELLLNHEQVIEACSLKVDCELYGEDYIAFARVKPEQGAAGLQDFLSRELGVARAPRQVVLCPGELPRNGAGKYDRKGLLALAGVEG
ncbi:class I adenylate-forming enzyme family protein [Chromobacterium phragmitis]|uniref:Class I adenylate-forming enzyme family protein n=1 Tax=Chromobacterium phragmitis TaxID=2202141 RepID=A0ABV0J1F2_9NEIS